MELLDGARLSEVLEPGGAWPQPHALAVIRDIGAAVAHAHSRGIVHGDLKPQNVFITHDGQVRVLDFGGTVAAEPWIGNPTAMPELSAVQARMQAHRLEEPYALGPFLAATPAYASCEQLEGQPADPRDDLYALACIAYQLLAGRHPFDGRSSLQARALRLRPTRPRALRADALACAAPGAGLRSRPTLARDRCVAARSGRGAGDRALAAALAATSLDGEGPAGGSACRDCGGAADRCRRHRLAAAATGRARRDEAHEHGSGHGPRGVAADPDTQLECPRRESSCRRSTGTKPLGGVRFASPSA